MNIRIPKIDYYHRANIPKPVQIVSDGSFGRIHVKYTT